MVYGVTFNGKHSLNDYGLYLAERPTIGNPEPQIYQIQVPGRNGLLDVTNSVTGDVTYSNRQLEFVFATMKDIEEQVTIRNELNNDLHGKEVRVVLDEDPDYYYTGRATVEWPEAEDWKARCTVSVDAEPYKRKSTLTEVSLTYRADEPGQHLDAEIGTNPTGTLSTQRITELHYGTKSMPTLDLEGFDYLKFYTEAAARWSGIRGIYIYDSSDRSYIAPFPANTVNPSVDVSDIENAGLDVSKICTIMIYGHAAPSATVTKCLGSNVDALLKAPVPITITPVLSVTCTQPIRVYVGGKFYDFSASGEYELEKMRIGPDGNMVVLQSPSLTNATAVLTYQEAFI